MAEEAKGAPVAQEEQKAPQADGAAKKKGGNKKGGGGGGKKGGGGGGGGGKKGKPKQVNLEDYPVPEFVQHRCAVWDRLQAEAEAQYAKEAAAGKGPIKVTLPNGDEKDAVAYETTPMEIAEGISKTLAQNCVVARLRWSEGDEQREVLWDMNRPIERSCSIELVLFDSPEGKHVFWHSSAHILGQAMERVFGGHLCVGPPVEKPGGFYYDMAMPEPEGEAAEKQVIVEDDFAVIDAIVSKISKEKQPFTRLVMKKEDALDMFKYSKYKSHIISTKVPDGATCTAYRCGPLIDLCRGPHVPHTGKVKAFKTTLASSAYWLGKAENDSLQRVYGVSFPDNKLLKAHLDHLEQLKLRDHRRIGKVQELFFFDVASPGSCFWLPHGTRIYQKLLSFIRNEYHERGFQEVVTPNMYTEELFTCSGHWQNYKDDMFVLEAEKQQFALKPMNCPGHCVIFKHRSRSYRELPLRIADCGVLHRNELSGALTGLTRVRRFQQDDAHIFCQHSQIGEEIANAIDFMRHVYGVFGFEFDLELSTRPEEKYLGEVAVWDAAEKQLAEVLDASGFPWKLNPGDGAFYGPKIDIHITDAIGRSHQCATIQLDFQLPIRFGLEYVDEKGEAVRPVMIHRAIFGSVERFSAILMEHTGGMWPLWLSPRQVLVVPVSPSQNEYAAAVAKRLHDAGFYADSELSGLKFAKKMALARDQKLYNYVLVVGKEEVEGDAVNVRTRENEVVGAKTVAEFVAQLKDEVAAYK